MSTSSARWRHSTLTATLAADRCGGNALRSLLHHVDHVVRGNHSDWPFQEEAGPFTLSLLIYALLAPDLYLTLRGRLMTGYWLFTAVVLFVVITLAHFVGSEREAPIRDTYAVHASAVWGLLALLDLAAIYAALAVPTDVFLTLLRRGRQDPR